MTVILGVNNILSLLHFTQCVLWGSSKKCDALNGVLYGKTNTRIHKVIEKFCQQFLFDKSP